MSDTSPLDTSALSDARRAALLALGIDPEMVVFPDSREEGDPSPSQPAALELEDDEWELISRYLPAEASQAHTLSNRAFLNAVLWLFARGRYWTQIAQDRGEAVRKRYARWAHARVWQDLYEAIKGAGLSPAREAQLQAMAERARRLRDKMLASRARH